MAGPRPDSPLKRTGPQAGMLFFPPNHGCIQQCTGQQDHANLETKSGATKLMKNNAPPVIA